MKITIENTSKIVDVNGVPARVWEGRTERGIKVFCFITRVAVSEDETPEVHELFRRELQETKKPTAEIQSFPLKMII